jgi:hypothetical protein
VTACLWGCARDPSSSGDLPAPPAAAVGASAVPADHLGPDELVEGKEQAFGIVLPRGLQVDERFVDTIHASGPVSVRALARYFRPRLTGGFLREGERSATFDGATAPGSPPDSLLTVHLEVQPGRTRVDITATKQHPLAVMPDDDSRWKAEGLSPNGRVLDPMHMH